MSKNRIGLPSYAGYICFCSNRVFSIIHQSCSLCICKRLVVPPKSPFFKYHKLAPCPDFLALAVCQLPKIVAGSCWWLSSGRFWMLVRALQSQRRHHPTNQPTYHPARSCCCCSSMDKQQLIWRAAQEETNAFEPETCEREGWVCIIFEDLMWNPPKPTEAALLRC